MYTHYVAILCQVYPEWFIVEQTRCSWHNLQTSNIVRVCCNLCCPIYHTTFISMYGKCIVTSGSSSRGCLMGFGNISYNFIVRTRSIP